MSGLAIDRDDLIGNAMRPTLVRYDYQFASLASRSAAGNGA